MIGATNKKGGVSITPPRTHKNRKKLFLYCFAQGLAGAEMRNLGSRNIDLIAGLRITADTGLPLGNRECPKTDKTDLLALLQIIGDTSEEAFKSIVRLALADSGISRNFVNHFFLGHSTNPLHIGFTVFDLMTEKTPFLNSMSTKKMKKWPIKALFSRVCADFDSKMIRKTHHGCRFAISRT